MTIDEMINIEHSLIIRYYLFETEIFSALKNGIDAKDFASKQDKFIADTITKKIGYNRIFDEILRKLFVYFPSVVSKELTVDRMLGIDSTSLALSFINEAKALNRQGEVHASVLDIDTKNLDNIEIRKEYKKNIIESAKQILKDQRTKLKACETKEDLLSYGVEIEIYEGLRNKLLKEGIAPNIVDQETINKYKITQREFLNTMCSFLKYAIDITPIEYNDELKKMFDPIKLGLLLSYKSMEAPIKELSQEENEEEYKKFNIDGIYAYWFYKYIMSNKEILNRNKNATINLIGKNKIIKKTLLEFITEFEDYYKNNMKDKMMLDPHKDIHNMSYKEYNDLYEKSFKEKLTKSEIKAAITDWEIIKNGNTFDSRKSRTKRKLEIYKNKETDYKKNIQILMDKIDYFDSTNYITTIEGINKMSGYIGYIYPNGAVSFEQFWDLKDETIPAIGKAIYVMDITNFLKLSQLTKPEIMEYIKTNNDNTVRRIYHSASWKERHNIEIARRVSTKEKDEYLMNFIQMLQEKSKENKTGNVKITSIDIVNCNKAKESNIKGNITGEVFDHNLVNEEEKILKKKD